jgi:hypothetical protein
MVGSSISGGLFMVFVVRVVGVCDTPVRAVVFVDSYEIAALGRSAYARHEIAALGHSAYARHESSLIPAGRAAIGVTLRPALVSLPLG